MMNDDSRQEPSYVVCWLDSRTFNGWVSKEAAGSLKLAEITTVGYKVLSDDPDVEILAQSMSDDGFINLTAIPRSSIQRWLCPEPQRPLL